MARHLELLVGFYVHMTYTHNCCKNSRSGIHYVPFSRVLSKLKPRHDTLTTTARRGDEARLRSRVERYAVPC